MNCKRLGASLGYWHPKSERRTAHYDLLARGILMPAGVEGGGEKDT
jgi:hypothetical protein